MSKKIKAAIIGLGARGQHYARCCKEFEDEIQITAVADVLPDRVRQIQLEFNLPDEQCFACGEDLLQQDRLADVVFICTQDREHFEPAMKAMKKGYHILLEKPISPFPGEWRELLKTAVQYHTNIVVCHVLRYTPFYQSIKKVIDAGTIGEVVSAQAMESVLWWHQAHSFVRGNWRNSNETSPMILQKCCHDLDILLWLTGKSCRRVTSMGNLYWFKPEHAPEGSGVRCVTCPVQKDCPYDAKKIYLTNKETGIQHGNNQWPCDVLAPNPTRESICKAIEEGPYGRCVYHCDNNVVDHQVVTMEMDDGAVIDLNMCAFTSGSRTLDIMGTKGEIKGNFSKNTFKVTVFGEEPVCLDAAKYMGNIKMGYDPYGHGGGDKYLIRDLIDLMRGSHAHSKTLTTLERSLESHFVALAAEESRLNGGGPVELKEFKNRPFPMNGSAEGI
ncbi:Gfo/Idh/MocA family oxidoreductase [Diplocloster hominis]|uniref:Gfo/Idh/MocA family protein n=1 Tax=Diplocloster hominis TaxID=3079010 RepID=UPI0031BB9531